jgi:hypothetical protein
MHANSLGVDTWLRGSITNQENVFRTTNLFLVSNAQRGEIISEFFYNLKDLPLEFKIADLEFCHLM